MTHPASIPASQSLLSVHQTVLCVLDILERRAEDFRDRDLPVFKAFEYGEPIAPAAFPMLAVIPSDGESEKDATGVGDTTHKIKIRAYWQVLDAPGVSMQRQHPWELLTRTIDWLRDLFAAHPALEDREGRARVDQCWPNRWAFEVLIQESRSGGDALLRSSELELSIREFERLTT